MKEETQSLSKRLDRGCAAKSADLSIGAER